MNEEGQIGEGSPEEETPQQGWSQEQPSQQPPRSTQGYQQQPVQRPPREDFLKNLTNNDNLAKIITVGFVLILVGMLVTHAAPFATNWGGDQYDDNMQDMTQEEMANDEATQNTMEYLGDLITDIGIFLVGLILVLGGIHRDDFDMKYRIAMISLAVLFILVSWFGLLAPLFQFG